MDIIIWILRVVTCALFAVVIFLMINGETISTVVLEGTLFLAILTSLLGGITRDGKK